jgi:glycosyltransferase involved in cell wall biosynthesis
MNRNDAPRFDEGSTGLAPEGRDWLRWILIAATDRSAAAAYARNCGIEPRLTVGKSELMTHPRRLREMIRNADIDAALVHSTDWQRQRNPQLYEVTLALMPVSARYIVDERTGTVQRIGAAGMATRIGRLPGDAVHVTGSIVGAGLRLARCKGLRHLSNRNGSSIVRTGRASVLVIWPGGGGGFGGSLTHISGILGAFRNNGCRIGLLTCYPPPQQLQRLVDDVEVVPGLRAASRLTGDTEQISADSHLRRLGLQFSQHIRPTFVYQRHSGFLLAGAEIARIRKIPLVLEWNGSEVWVRKNWDTQLGVERLLDPLHAAFEREIVSSATLITAVSRVAAEMALESGATLDKTLVLPNAVNIEEIDSIIDYHPVIAGADSPGPLLGWAGSFGQWHGATVAVEALTRLPVDVRLVMIGDGEERPGCESVAESLGVAERIEWTGVLPRAAALRRLAECDILLSPHTPLPDQPFFGSPTKLFEYMALARPIVASRLGQLGEVLEDGVTARLVAPGEVDELAGAVMEILNSPDRGSALGDAARRAVARSHTWDQRGRAILERLGYEVEPRTSRPNVGLDDAVVG